jgi:DNA-binding transcriptional MerR regulator
MPLKTIKEEDLKIYYSIGEVARHFGVNPSLIRFWEKEFPQLKPRKNRRGARLYTKKDIQLLETIFRLVKIEGYTLEGARKHLSAHRSDASPPHENVNIAAEASSISESETSRMNIPPHNSLTQEERHVLREKLLNAYAGLLKIEQKLKHLMQCGEDNSRLPTLFKLDGHI